MKVLVAAASGTARPVRSPGRSARCSPRGLDVTVTAPEQVDGVAGYDAVVLGSAVYAGCWLTPARELVDRAGSQLATPAGVAVSSGPIGAPPKPDEGHAVDVTEVLAATGAREQRLFAGKLARKGLSFGERAMVVAFRTPDGDLRDWAAITRWAATIARTLQSQT